MSLQTIRNLKIKNKEFIYDVCYASYLLYTLLGASFFVKYYISFYTYGVAIILLPLIMSEIVFGRLNKKTIVSAIPCLIMLLIIMRVSDNRKTIHIAALLLFIFCARNLNFAKIAKITVTVDILVLLLVIASSKLDIIQNYISISFGRRREYLGFLYALTPLTIFSNVVLLELFLYKSDLSFFKIGIYGIVAYLLYVVTDSRLNFIVIIFALIIAIGLKLFKLENLVRKKIIAVIMLISIPLCAYISTYLANSYSGSGITEYLNTILGSRIRLAHSALSKYGIRFLGNNITWSGWGLNSLGEVSKNQYNYVDNAYVQILVQYGVIVFVLIIVYFLFLQIFLYKRNEYLLSMILTLIAIHGLIDDSILSLAYNTFWILFASVLSKKFSLCSKNYIS